MSVSTHNNISSVLGDRALQLKLATEEVSPYIQQITSAVCPTCEKVCCINRHGHYDDVDLIYVRALAIEIPPYRKDLKDTDPCQFLSKYGCSLERSVRPFRCNWYFCDDLIKYMEKGPTKLYREFVNRFRRIVELRDEMLSSSSRVE
jgi:hypothetical protein